MITSYCLYFHQTTFVSHDESSVKTCLSQNPDPDVADANK